MRGAESPGGGEGWPRCQHGALRGGLRPGLCLPGSSPTSRLTAPVGPEVDRLRRVVGALTHRSPWGALYPGCTLWGGVRAWIRTPRVSQHETPRPLFCEGPRTPQGCPGVPGGQEEAAPGVAWLSSGSESLQERTGNRRNRVPLLLFSASA